MTLVFLSLSLACLLLSIIIFRSLPSLHCLRVTIHTNLFLSLALNNLAWILWYNLGNYLPPNITRKITTESVKSNFIGSSGSLRLLWGYVRIKTTLPKGILLFFHSLTGCLSSVLFQPWVWAENSVWCRGLHTTTTALMLSTYFWMLCEGTYLRRAQTSDIQGVSKKKGNCVSGSF